MQNLTMKTTMKSKIVLKKKKADLKKYKYLKVIIYQAFKEIVCVCEWLLLILRVLQELFLG